MHVLIAEDDPISRKLLETYLNKWGYQTISVDNGAAALQVLTSSDAPQMAILDWMMPELDGVEVCVQFRSRVSEKYVYLMLLTSKGYKEDVIRGLQAGADDYLIKPFDKDELRARLNVGMRVIHLENLLKQQLMLVSEANTTITWANQKMKASIKAAAQVQMNLLPPSTLNFGGVCVNSIYLPSEDLGGDMLHVFAYDENYIVFYVLDVSGHGIPSALLSVTIRNQLSQTFTTSNSGSLVASSLLHVPGPLVSQLSAYYGDLMDRTGQYFTLLYATLHRKSGEFCYVQAGHPAPIYLHQGQIVYADERGELPVGMFPTEYTERRLFLNPGDRLYLYTDGLIEASRPEHTMYGKERFAETLKRHAQLPSSGLQPILAEVLEWTGKEQFEDDATLIEIQLESLS